MKKVFFYAFQLGDTFSNTLGGVAQLHHFHQIVKALIHVSELVLQSWKLLVVLQVRLGLSNCHVCQRFNALRREDILCETGYHTLEGFFLHGLLLAAVLFPARHAGIIIVFAAMPTGTTLSDHMTVTMAAKEFHGEQVVYQGFPSGRRLRVLPKAFLYRVKGCFVNDCRHTALKANVFVFVHTDIPFVLKHTFEAGCPELSSFCGSIPGSIEPGTDFCNAAAGGIEFKRLLYNGSRGRINDQLLVFHFIAQRDDATSAVAFQGCFGHSAGDFLGKLFAVKLGHPLKHGF